MVCAVSCLVHKHAHGAWPAAGDATYVVDKSCFGLTLQPKPSTAGVDGCGHPEHVLERALSSR
jgi:hypothetical protein